LHTVGANGVHVVSSIAEWSEVFDQIHQQEMTDEEEEESSWVVSDEDKVEGGKAQS
jgi:hypothetical protein